MAYIRTNSKQGVTVSLTFYSSGEREPVFLYHRKCENRPIGNIILEDQQPKFSEKDEFGGPDRPRNHGMGF